MSNDRENKSDKTMIITEKVDLGERVATHEPYLIQISGRETGQMHKLVNRLVKIGRDPTSEIIVDDPHVSRNHAEVEYKSADQILIRDVGSTNGVFVNGKRVTQQQLYDGDKILIGTRLYFKLAYQDAVEQTYQQNLFRAANMDNLTQVYNKKYFLDVLSKEFSFSKRNGNPLSLLMMDLDFFKRINDTFGHMAGDAVLKNVGQYLLKNLRMENVACRYGGEEFAIILRNANAEQALNTAERLRTGLAAEQIAYNQNQLTVTVSAGIATLKDDNFNNIEELIEAADKNLYEAKAGGRNRTVSKVITAPPKAA